MHSLYYFNTALNTNTPWRVLNQDSIWHRVVLDKYLQNTTLVNWLRKPTHFISSTSRVWSSLVRTIPIILHWLSWRPGAGHLIMIGRDRILGLGERSILLNDTINLVKIRNRLLFLLKQWWQGILLLRRRCG